MYYELHTPIKARDFKAIGCYAGTSIAQGGLGFPVLADAAYHYMTTEETTGLKVSNEDLPLQLKNVVDQVA